MTVSNQTNSVSYSGNGSTIVFAYTFKIFANSDLIVTLRNNTTGALTTQTLTTDYTVSGAGSDSGGNVTFGTAPPSGTTVLIRRSLPYTQETDYVENDPFPAASHEDALDKLTMLAQQNKEEDAIKFPEGDVAGGINNITPSIANRANSYLTFDGSGNVSVQQISAAGANTSITQQDFTGDGSTTAFTLSTSPGAGGSGVSIYIDGIYQERDTYSISDTTLTFTEAPPLNASIEVINYRVADIGTADANNVTYSPNGSGAVQTTVQSKLRETVSIKDFGAVCDGVTDDSAAVQAAADYCVANGLVLYAPSGSTVYLASAVDLRFIKYINFNSNILVSQSIAGVPVTIGGFAQQIGGRWVFNDVSDGSSVITGTPPSRPVFRLFGAKAAHIELGSCQYFQLYADADVNTGTSTAYNNIYLHGAVYKMELFGEVANSWVNENWIYSGRIKKLIVDGTYYGHNHNKWFNPTMEGSDVDVQFLGLTHENQIYGVRFELVSGSSGVTFESGTYNNLIIQTWSGTGRAGDVFTVPSIPVSDQGVNNLITFDHSTRYRRTTIFSVDSESMVVGNNSDSTSPDYRIGRPLLDRPSKALIVPGLKKLSVLNAFRFVAMSGMIPVDVGDVIAFNADTDTNLFRLRIYIFDENQQPITDEFGGGRYVLISGITSLSSSSGYGVYAPAANLPSSLLKTFYTGTVNRSDVKYIRVAFEMGTAGDFESLSAYLWTKPVGRQKAETSAQDYQGMPALNGAPTRGYVPLGFAVLNTATSSVLHVSYAWETQVDGAISSGGTSVTVVDEGSIANGDIVGILLDDDTTHWTSVSSKSGSSFSIDAIPAGRSVDDGARIVFNRWS